MDESFLDLDFAFEFDDPIIPEPNFEIIDDQISPVSFEPLDLLSEHSQNIPFHNNDTNESTISNQIEESFVPSEKSKDITSIAKSKLTKNICFNICQKTVKVMKTRIYNKKLEEISANFGLNSEKVIHKMLKVKKDLTGPKALQMFVENDDPVSQVFKKFMKWFLQEKYLRHAINEGTMDDLKGYLEFKNSVIMNLLEDWLFLLYFFSLFLFSIFY